MVHIILITLRKEALDRTLQTAAKQEAITPTIHTLTIREDENLFHVECSNNNFQILLYFYIFIIGDYD